MRQPVILMLIPAHFCFVPNVKAQAPSPTAEVMSINAYGNTAEDYANNHPESNRYFADTARHGKPQWREFSDKWKRAGFIPYFQQANCSTQNSRTVYVHFSTWGDHSDAPWSNQISYVFRNDGSLARAWSGYITYKEGEPSLLVVRKWFYGSRGMLLRSTKDIFDAKATHSKLKRLTTAKYQDTPVPVYKKVSDLPFYKFLKKPRPKS